VKRLSSRPNFSERICHISLNFLVKSFLPQDILVSSYLSEEIPTNLSAPAHEYYEEVAMLIKMAQKKLLGDVSELAINSAHGVAFHRGLGTPLFPSSSTPLTKYLNADSIAEYAKKAYTKSNIAVVANGASQADLTKWVGEFFTDAYTGEGLSGPGATKYYGGEERIAHDSGNSFVLAFPGSSSFTAGESYKPEVAVLAALLGGKSNIKWSAGFSLLSKAASSFPGARARATHHAYSDAGLLTIEFSGSASAIKSATHEAVKALRAIADGSISQEDFTKAVANAKYNALEEGQNIEAGVVSTGAGLAHGGSAFQIDQIGKAVEAVSIEKLKAVCISIFQQIQVLTNTRLQKQCWRARRQSRQSVISMSFLMQKNLVFQCRARFRMGELGCIIKSS
jgi:ubiquinol-cytochrome c reductase core subunit 2